MAKTRAAALSALSDGYTTLLNARQRAMDGQSTLFDGEYETAQDSFQMAATKSNDARETFEMYIENEVFGPVFEEGVKRADALAALADGYQHLTTGLQAIEKGKESFEQRDFNTAADQFGSAKDSIATARSRFDEGHETISDEFSTEFDRAQCQGVHLASATDHFATATEAANSGDQSRAATQREHGETALEDTTEC